MPPLNLSLCVILTPPVACQSDSVLRTHPANSSDPPHRRTTLRPLVPTHSSTPPLPICQHTAPPCTDGRRRLGGVGTRWRRPNHRFFGGRRRRGHAASGWRPALRQVGRTPHRQHVARQHCWSQKLVLGGGPRRRRALRGRRPPQPLHLGTLRRCVVRRRCPIAGGWRPAQRRVLGGGERPWCAANRLRRRAPLCVVSGCRRRPTAPESAVVRG